MLEEEKFSRQVDLGRKLVALTFLSGWVAVAP